MKALTRQQQNRWEAAKLLVERMLAKARFVDAHFLFDGQFIDVDQIVISDTRIVVECPDHRATYLLFEADPDTDHGLHDTINDFRTYLKQRFRMIKEINW